MKDAIKRRKKVCPRCGRKLWLRDFHLLKDGSRQGWCRECMAAYKRDAYARTRKKTDGTFLSKKWNRLVVKKGLSTRFHWNENDLLLLRRHFPNTPTMEIAQMFGVSTRTIERIASRMGLKKDKDYILGCQRNGLMVANLKNPKLFANKVKERT